MGYRKIKEIKFKGDRKIIDSPLESVFKKVNKQNVKLIVHSLNSIKIWRDYWRCFIRTLGSPKIKKKKN